MLEAIRRATSFLRQKQILHKLGVVISIAVIGIACYVLYHMLRGIDFNEVLEAIKEADSGKTKWVDLDDLDENFERKKTGKRSQRSRRSA